MTADRRAYRAKKRPPCGGRHSSIVKTDGSFLFSVIHHRNRLLVPGVQIPDIFPGLLRDHVGEQKHGYQVRNRHQSVQNIRDIPDESSQNQFRPLLRTSSQSLRSSAMRGKARSRDRGSLPCEGAFLTSFRLRKSSLSGSSCGEMRSIRSGALTWRASALWKIWRK